MADLSKLRIVSTITILNKVVQIFKEEMGLIMTYSIEFDDPEDPTVFLTIDLPKFSCIFKAKIKAVEIANLVSKKNPYAVAEDLATFFIQDMTNLIINEILYITR